DCRRSGSMPRRDTMRLQNDRALSLLLAVIFVLSSGIWAQSTAPSSSPQSAAPSNAGSQNEGPASPPPPLFHGSNAPSSAPAGQASSPQTPSNAPSGSGDQAAPADQQGQAPDKDSGTFVFKAEVQEVTLHATVVDEKQRLITNLDRNAFTVFENGQPQVIKDFRHEDVQVAMGIVIDNSGSMREKRDKVNKAALNLVRSSNPQDQVFVVNFNDEYYLDQDFTGDVKKLGEALEKLESRGGTALYDAVVASADHLAKNAKLSKKVLFVVTDGEDNASRESLEQAVRRLQEENGP